MPDCKIMTQIDYMVVLTTRHWAKKSKIRPATECADKNMTNHSSYLLFDALEIDIDIPNNQRCIQQRLKMFERIMVSAYMI